MVLFVVVAMSASGQTKTLFGVSSDSLPIVMSLQESYFISANHKRKINEEFQVTQLSFPYYFMVDNSYQHGGYYSTELIEYTVHCSINDSVAISDIITTASLYQLVPGTLRDVIFLIQDLQASKIHVASQHKCMCLEDVQQYGIFTAEIPYPVFFGYILSNTGITETAISYGFLKNGDSVVLKKKQ